MRQRLVKRVVSVTEEACLPPQILLDLAPGVPQIGVHAEGRIVAEGRWQVPVPALDLQAHLWLVQTHGQDRHPECTSP
jgi:hypothetical protein